MKNDDDSDFDLKGAFRAVKDEYDGSSPDADLTLHRALFASRLQTRRRKVVRWSLIPIAAALFASTAWAGATGRLAPVVETVREVFHAESAPAEPAPTPSLGYARAAPPPSDEAGSAELAQNDAPDASAPEPTPPHVEAANAGERTNAGAPPSDGADERTSSNTPGTPAARANAGSSIPGTPDGRANTLGTPGARANAGQGSGSPTGTLGALSAPANGSTAAAPNAGRTASSPSAAAAALARSSATPDLPTPAEAKPAAAPRPVVDDPNAQLFAEAHRLHFVDRDPARALGAWDRYLAAAPNGSLAPEARYNRALALIRLDRTSEARAELEKFANGNYSGYRRTEARALLDALTRDAGP